MLEKTICCIDTFQCPRRVVEISKKSNDLYQPSISTSGSLLLRDLYSGGFLKHDMLFSIAIYKIWFENTAFLGFCSDSLMLSSWKELRATEHSDEVESGHFISSVGKAHSKLWVSVAGILTAWRY